MKRLLARIESRNSRLYLIASLLALLLLCHWLGGFAATAGVPIACVVVLLLMVFHGLPDARKRSNAKPVTEPLLRRLAQSKVDSSVAEVQLSALGPAFRKDQWEQTESSVDAIIDSCIQLIRLRVDAHTVAVFFPDAEDGYRLRRFWSRSGHVDPQGTILPGRGILGGMFKNGLKNLNLKEIVTESTTLYYYIRDAGVRSLIACPIVTAGAPRGLIIADSTMKQAFSEEHISFISMAADLLGRAVFNAYFCTQHALEHLRLAAVSTIEKEFFRHSTLDSILDIVVEIIPIALLCDRMTISMRTDNGENAIIRRVHGVHIKGLLRAGFSLSEKNLASVLYSKNLCFARNFAAGRYEIRYFEDEPRSDDFSSFLAVPLGVDEARGMILLESFRLDAFSDSLRSLVSRIATSAGLAMERVFLFEQANALATHDGLTGLFNHRQFQQLLKDEITRSRRYGDLLSLILCDIDFFKKINDTHGHEFGNVVLKQIASLLESSIRQRVDTAARYGGEEFALVLVKTGKTQAIETAERIRALIEQSAFPDPAGGEVRVTVSFGIAVLGEHVREIDDLIKRADRALYRAKEQGRNRVEAL